MSSGSRRAQWALVTIGTVAVVAVVAVAVGVPPFDGRDTAYVTFVDESGRDLGTLRTRVADTPAERYTGLSDTESLGPNEGMLFVHDREIERAYVMRRMSFPIDIVFVDVDGRVTVVHHAAVERPPLTRYRGRGRWVVEAPHHWTTRHGVTAGDRARIRIASESEKPPRSTESSVRTRSG